MTRGLPRRARGGPATAGEPVVAIVGRPNVGKSALFNRLLGSRTALVEDLPGTTRDRLYGRVRWSGREFLLVDTGGFDLRDAIDYAAPVREQVRQALEEGSLILLVVDVVDGVTPADLETAALVRASGKPRILVANKADTEARAEAAVQFYELGLGEPLPVSAYHGLGVDHLLDSVVEALPTAAGAALPEEAALGVAIVGRPNVGKSLLVNAILGTGRVIVSETPGTTRDAVDTPFTYRGRALTLIDTAGLRRRGHVAPGVERHSVLRARAAIARAEVAVLVVDVTEPLTAQDLHVAGYVDEAAKGLVVALNKWDLVQNRGEAEPAFRTLARKRLRFAPWAEQCFVSARERWGIDGLLDLVLAVERERGRRAPTRELNTLVRRVLAEHPPPSRGRRQFKVLYAAQAGVNPPTFVLFANDPSLAHFSYRRYLENRIRETYGFRGTPLRLIVKSRSGE